MPQIDDGHIEPVEVSRITCRNRGTARLGDAGDEGVAEIDATTRPLAIGSELSRRDCGHLVEGEHTIRKVFREDAVKRVQGRLRRRPFGKSVRPNRASNTMILVSHTESAGWRSNQSTTTASGVDRISADSTFVSRTIRESNSAAVAATPRHSGRSPVSPRRRLPPDPRQSE